MSGSSKSCVILCTHNGAKFIIELLTSLKQSNLKPDLLFIADWGSTDNTFQIAIDYMIENPFCAYETYCSRETPGVRKSFLKASALALNLDSEIEYFLFCDQDDIWFSNKLAEQLKVVKNTSEIELVYTNVEFLEDRTGLVTGTQYSNKSNFALRRGSHYFDAGVLFANPVIGMTMLVSRNCLSNFLAADEYGFTHYHDWDLVIFCHLNNRLVYCVEEPRVKYRQHTTNLVGAQKRSRTSYVRKYFRLGVSNWDRYKAINTAHDIHHETKLIECLKIIKSSKHFTFRFKVKLIGVMLVTWLKKKVSE